MARRGGPEHALRLTALGAARCARRLRGRSQLPPPRRARGPRLRQRARAGHDRRGVGHGRCRADLHRRRRHPRAMVDAVRIAEAQCAGRAVAQGQSQHRRRARLAARGLRPLQGAAHQPAADGAGRLRCDARQEPGRNARQPHQPAAGQSLLQPLHRAADPQLHAGRLRRHAPRSRGDARASARRRATSSSPPTSRSAATSW